MAKTFKQILEFSDQQIAQLSKAYAPLRGKRLSDDQIQKLRAMVKKMDPT